MSYQKNYPNGWQSGEAGGTPITPAALDNIENGIANALPKDGTDPMTADLPMGGHRVTGLGEPVADGDAVSRGYANGHFAPAGYGLGVHSLDTPFISTIAQLEDTRVNRWFIFTGGEADPIMVSGYSIRYAGGRVDTYNHGNVVMTLRPYDPWQLRYDGSELRRICNEGKWEPWEWKNPPMEPGVEYRTTERFYYNGASYPVYTMELYCGGLPASGYEVYPFPDAVKNAIAITEWSGFITFWGIALPDTGGDFKVRPTLGRNGVVKETNVDRSEGGEVYIKLKYIKAT